jgi:pSer/pThr/pTyr-binding forkhead associated (FHA) protein/outer membrane protein assembly factor BamB
MEDDVRGHEEEMNEQTQEEELDEKTCLENSPKITVKTNGEIVLEYEMLKNLVVIGRRAGNDIVLDSRKVSRKHAQIKREGDDFTIEDLQSTGGTEIHGEKITSRQISTGEIIKIGDFELHFNSGIEGEEKTVFEEEDKTIFDDDKTVFYEEPIAKLIVERSQNLEGEISIEGETIIGRGEEATIQLEDQRASREHCKIVLVENNFVLTDLESSNGTYVNGEKVTEKPLENGDKIQIGDAVFEFQMEIGVKGGTKKIIGKKLVKNIGLVALGVFVFVVLFQLANREKPHSVVLSQIWEKQVKGEIRICPAIGDLNNDTFNDIVVADTEGFIYAMDGRTGGSIWNKPYIAGRPVLSSPVLGNINHEGGNLDVIIGAERKRVIGGMDSSQTGKVFAIDGDKGKLIWESSVVKGGIISSPALADLNADKVLDAVVGSKDKFIYALDGRQGGEIWNFETESGIGATPSLTDINSDGVLDVIVGAKDNLYALSGTDGKKLWLFHRVGNPSSTAIGKFDEDDIDDVVVAFAGEIVVLNGKTGAIIWEWESSVALTDETSLPIAPVLGDINNDGILDVVCGSDKGHVYAVNGVTEGEKYLWDFNMGEEIPFSAALFDFNGDKTIDVAIVSRKGIIYLVSGEDGHLLCQFDIHSPVEVPLVIADVNANGIADLVVGTLDGKVIVVESNAKCNEKEIIWGVLGGNSLHTARAK